MKKKKKRACGLCGQAFRNGRRVEVLVDRALRPAILCQSCAALGVTIVAPALESQVRAAGALFARHFRKLAKGYRVHDDACARGLELAANMLESGRLPPTEGAIDLPRAPKSNGAAPKPRTVDAHPLPPARGDHDDELVVAAAIAAGKVPASTPAAAAQTASGLSKIERAILSALADRAAPMAAAAIVFATGFKMTGSFTTAIADLRRAEFIEGPGKAIAITSAGRAELAEPVALLRGATLFEHWERKIDDPCGRKILRALYEIQRQGLLEPDAARLRDLIGYRPSGSVTTALALLRRLAMVERRALRLTPVFYEEVSR